MTDPAWFYSSLSQVSAAVVGFLGGFVLIRLIDQSKEWGRLIRGLESAQGEWHMMLTAIESRRMNHTSIPAENIQEESRRWNELVRLIQEKEDASFPREYLVTGVLLILLIGVGILWPLLSFEEPALLVRLQFAVPWIGLVLLFVAAIGWVALGQLRKVQVFRLWPHVEGKYEQHLLEVDAMEARRNADESSSAEGTSRDIAG